MKWDGRFGRGEEGREGGGGEQSEWNVAECSGVYYDVGNGVGCWVGSGGEKGEDKSGMREEPTRCNDPSPRLTCSVLMTS